MLKIILTFLLFFISNYSFSQSPNSTLIDSIKVDVDIYYGKDALGFDYFSKNNVLYKQKKSEKWEYKNLSLGKIESIDFINPLKTLLFYRDFNTAILLDNQFSEIQKVNFNDFNLLAKTCSHSASNKLWIYDELSNHLVLLDYINKKVTALNQPFKSNFQKIYSNYNHWYKINSDNSVIIYDIYGRISKGIVLPKYDKILFTETGKILFSLNDNLYLYQSDQELSIELLSSDNEIKNFNFILDTLTIFSNNTITNYRIKLP